MMNEYNQRCNETYGTVLYRDHAVDIHSHTNYLVQNCSLRVPSELLLHSFLGPWYDAIIACRNRSPVMYQGIGKPMMRAFNKSGILLSGCGLQSACVFHSLRRR